VLETPRGARAEIFLTWAAEERSNRAVIEGNLGAVRLEDDRLDARLRESSAPLAAREFPQPLSEGSHHPEWFAPVAARFLEEIEDPAAQSRTLEEAFLCLSIIELARESSRRGGETLALSADEAGLRRAAR
jgi:hypothetical protein